LENLALAGTREPVTVVPAVGASVVGSAVTATPVAVR
jgi:hypothetical protein